jgi:RND superfamily putative drug exporter
VSDNHVDDGSLVRRIARTIRWWSVPIVLVWLLIAVITNVFVPQLEEVGKAHNVGLSSPDAPSLQAMKRMGKVFHEFDSDSAAMIVLEGEKPLGADAHRFYDTLIRKLEQDSKHVEHIQDFWGDPLTAAGSQSKDGKAAYVQVFVVGNQGEAKANESVDAIRDIVDHTPKPPGVKAYVTGAAPLIADQFAQGSKGTATVTAITVVVIAVMLFWVYRSVVTTILVLLTVLIEMAAARGFVAFLGNAGVIGLSTYATTCSRCWSSPPERITRYSLSAGIKKRVQPAKTGKPPSIPCLGAPPTWSWARV